MKILLTLSLAFLWVPLNAQTIVDKKDEFTGKQTKCAVVFFGKKVFGAPIFGVMTPSVTFTDMGEKKSMFFNFPGFNTQISANANEEIKPDKCSILLKMENDTIVRFIPDSTKSFVMHNGTTYSVSVNVFLSYDQVQYLIKNKIKIFRFAVNGDEGTDITLLTDKNKKEIQRSAMFLLGLQEMDSDN